MPKRKILAVLVAIAYLISSATTGWPTTFFGMLFLVLFSLPWILFSEQAGEYKGIASWRYGHFVWITKESPPGMVEFMGWVFLFLPIVIYLLTRTF